MDEHTREHAIFLTREKLLDAMEAASERFENSADLMAIAEFSVELEDILFGGESE